MYNLRYLFGKSPYWRPWYRLLGIEVRRLGQDDYVRAYNVQGGGASLSHKRARADPFFVIRNYPNAPSGVVNNRNGSTQCLRLYSNSSLLQLPPVRPIRPLRSDSSSPASCASSPHSRSTHSRSRSHSRSSDSGYSNGGTLPRELRPDSVEGGKTAPNPLSGRLPLPLRLLRIRAGQQQRRLKQKGLVSSMVAKSRIRRRCRAGGSGATNASEGSKRRSKSRSRYRRLRLRRRKERRK
jgi:hypothetical protein